VSKDVPKLHGWITPEYACEMTRDMLKYLYCNQKEDFEYFRDYIKNFEIAENK
jgi:hypothetical protein